MKFLLDAQLPARLARFLNNAGHDTVHTSELPDGNRTTDGWIAELADGDDRVVVTKDRDFRDGHLLAGSPRRLLIVATGNITNAALMTFGGEAPRCDCRRARRGQLRRARPGHPGRPSSPHGRAQELVMLIHELIGQLRPRARRAMVPSNGEVLHCCG